MQCKMTCKKLDQLKVPYQYKDVSTDDFAREHLLSLGYSSVPVVHVRHEVHTPTTTWCGYNPDALNALV